MEHTTVVGIDVSKNRLDVHVLRSQEAWAVSRDADGLAELCRRLAGMSGVVALEATGGYENIVAASLSSAGLPWSWSTGLGAGFCQGAGPARQD